MAVIVPVVALGFLGLHRAELLAPDLPAWLPPALLAMAGGIVVGLDHVIPTGPSRAEDARVLVAAGTVWVVIYVTGWGAALAPGFLVWVAMEVNWRGLAGSARRIAAIPVGMGIGQTAIALGVAPTLIPEPEVHGLAVLTAGLTTFAAILVQRAASEQRHGQQALLDSEERFRSIVQSIADLVIVLDEQLLVTYASPASRTLLGLEPEAMVGMSALDFVHHEDLPRIFDGLQEALSSANSSPAALLRARHADGSWRWMELGATNLLDDPAVGGIVVNARDVTVRQDLEEQLAQLAYYDALTKLPNRRAFADRAEQAIARADRQSVHLAVLFVDLDGFKPVNDTLGHEIGDLILERVGERLRAAVRAEDTVARLGGDEFTVLVEDLRFPDATSEIARRIIAALSTPLVVQGHNLVVTASIGIAAWNPLDPIPVEELIRMADLAMYVAKSKGKARFEFYERGLPAFAARAEPAARTPVAPPGPAPAG